MGLTKPAQDAALFERKGPERKPWPQGKLRNRKKQSHCAFRTPTFYQKSESFECALGPLSQAPKKAHKHKEMGPQNWTLDPTPKTPLDPPHRNSLCTVFCWENQHLHKEFGRLNPVLDPPARVPPKFFMQIFFGCFFRL